MDTQPKNSELVEIADPVTITLSASEYQEIIADKERLLNIAMTAQDDLKYTLEELEKKREQMDKLLEEILKISAVHEENKKLSAQLTICVSHLRNMLSEHEATFNREHEFQSAKFGMEYIEAEKFARAFGHQSDSERFIKEWVDSKESLPFPVWIRS